MESLKQLAENYETERATLLRSEGDLDKLWRVVIAADKLSKAVLDQD